MRRFLRNFLLVTLATALIGSALYLVHLDSEIRARFDGVRWAVPSKVYAAPLELYPGKGITPAQLEEELERLGYRRADSPDRPGSYRREGNEVRLVSRAFLFWDGEQPSRRLFVRFAAGGIREIIEPGVATSHTLVRLDPVSIGSIHAARAEDRLLLTLDEVPELLQRGLVEVEDRHFYRHRGVSLRGIARAMVANVRAGRVVQGGSTITQQLVRNFFLTLDQTLARKLREAVMAVLLELHYDKDEILEAYINEIYLGQDGDRAIHGFGLASGFYFNKPAQELDTKEIALLIGLAKGASYYNPRRRPERAEQRRAVVLGVLQEAGLLDEEAAASAASAPLGVLPAGAAGAPVRYPAFIDLVRRQLRDDYRESDLQSEGLRIFTTLEPRAQAALEAAIEQQLSSLESIRGLEGNSLQAAGILARTEGGEISALAGGRDGRYRGFNRALDARRQIGSLAKPFVYYAALAEPERFNLYSMLRDEPLRLELPNGQVWEPSNFDADKVHGDVRLYEALAYSYNLASAHLGLDVGPQKVARVMQRAGLERAPAALPSLSLGAIDLSPLQVAQMYATLASGGFRYPLTSIREVTDANGEPLSRYGMRVERGLDESATYLTNWALEQVTVFGTGRGIYRWLPPTVRIAGKTGTTNAFRDAWFAGYGGDRLGVIWVGDDDNRPIGLSGSSGALPIWSDTMQRLQVQSFEAFAPVDVERVQLDRESGLLADEYCRDVVEIPFAAAYPPKEYAPCARSQRDEQRGIRGWFDRLFQ